MHAALLQRYASYRGYHGTMEKGFGETDPGRKRIQRLTLGWLSKFGNLQVWEC